MDHFGKSTLKVKFKNIIEVKTDNFSFKLERFEMNRLYIKFYGNEERFNKIEISYSPNMNDYKLTLENSVPLDLKENLSLFQIEKKEFDNIPPVVYSSKFIVSIMMGDLDSKFNMIKNKNYLIRMDREDKIMEYLPHLIPKSIQQLSFTFEYRWQIFSHSISNICYEAYTEIIKEKCVKRYYRDYKFEFFVPQRTQTLGDFGKFLNLNFDYLNQKKLSLSYVIYDLKYNQVLLKFNYTDSNSRILHLEFTYYEDWKGCEICFENQSHFFLRIDYPLIRRGSLFNKVQYKDIFFQFH